MNPGPEPDVALFTGAQTGHRTVRFEPPKGFTLLSEPKPDWSMGQTGSLEGGRRRAPSRRVALLILCRRAQTGLQHVHLSDVRFGLEA